jgi:UDP-glucuronate 4-epimerase
MSNKILVTGAAGFIGFHLCKRLLQENYEVIGLDNMNDYYDVNLKKDRLKILLQDSTFKFNKIDLIEKDDILDLFKVNSFDFVINLAAQAGVRYSLINPYAYLNSNITGFLNILEGCRHYPVKHLIFASSSSVYGANTKMPFSVHHNVDHPISLYAATKKANELMAHTYANLYGTPSTGLRFFTVYGPWGRPDMALFLFTKAIFDGQPIDVFNHGKMKRDFTYVDDIVEGIIRLIPQYPEANNNWDGNDPDPSSSFVPYKLYNIGNNQPVELMKFIETIEYHAGKEAIKNFMDIQKGDVPATYANVDDLTKDVGFRPDTSIEVGIGEFVRWYKTYYNIK